VIQRRLGFGILFFLMLAGIQCTTTKSASGLPKDILGIGVGMNRAEAGKRLAEIAEFERDERKRQQVWRLKDDPHFKYIAVGYDENEKIRYVAAFADATAKERIRFSDVGDLSTAKKEVVEPHYRYIWEVPSSDGKPAYIANIYGDNPDFLLHYSLSGITTVSEKEEEEDE